MSMEHRKYLRHSAAIPITVSLIDESLTNLQFLSNVSSGGLAFKSENPWEDGKTVTISFPLPYDFSSDLLKVYGRVVWCRYIESDQYDIGVEFLQSAETAVDTVFLVEKLYAQLEQQEEEQTFWLPHITVAAVIETEGRFLLVEEDVNGMAVFNQPAGHLDKSESITNAVIRETLEETAWHFTPTEIIGIYQYTNPLNDTTYLRIVFCGKHHDYSPDLPLDKEIIRTVWMTREEIIEQPLRSPMVLRAIDDYLNGVRYPLNIITML
ncbi:NUDIX domain-containing protein [Beggiatoa leptomitoformis]|nr:NUDIX domain-containing protein [Beggiatoa leptomitoformis]